jgi:hypothetical protein
MMPQPPQQRPARMPSGPSPTMGGGMPNRPDMLRQQAEQTLPSMPPMGGGRPPMGGWCSSRWYCCFNGWRS